MVEEDLVERQGLIPLQTFFFIYPSSQSNKLLKIYVTTYYFKLLVYKWNAYGFDQKTRKRI